LRPKARNRPVAKEAYDAPSNEMQRLAEVAIREGPGFLRMKHPRI